MQPLTAALTALLLAQVLKIFTVFPPRFYRIIGSGGMPSSHASFVTSLTAMIGIKHGLDSDLFAIVTVFSLIIIYDAGGVRRAVGEQANVINRLVQDLDLTRLEEEREYIKKELKELIGHTPFEIFAGILLGIIVAFLAS
ncbi:MAG: divergent PAP2 family protein [Bacillota bacterium]